MVRLDEQGRALPAPRAEERVPARMRLHRTDTGLRSGDLALAPDPAGTVSASLAVLAAADLRVDLDLVALTSPRRDAVRAHAWHGRLGRRVVGLASSDDRVYELSWFPAESWHDELARAVRVSSPRPRGLGSWPALPADLELPWELLMASGAARRSGRADLVAELARRHAAGVLLDGAEPPASLLPVLTALHVGTVARLRAWVRRPLAGARPGADRLPVGRVDWLHHGDGWRRLSGSVRDGRRLLRLESVTELDLGVEVSRLAARLAPRPAPRPAPGPAPGPAPRPTGGPETPDA